MNGYEHLVWANSVKDAWFDGIKDRFFRYINEKFDSSFSNETVDDYNFYMKDEEWLVRYDRGIRCWFLAVDGRLIMNRYDSGTMPRPAEPPEAARSDGTKTCICVTRLISML